MQIWHRHAGFKHQKPQSICICAKFAFEKLHASNAYLFF